MATAKKSYTKKGGEYDPVCEAIARDKNRPKSIYEMRQAEQKKASASKGKKK